MTSRAPRFRVAAACCGLFLIALAGCASTGVPAERSAPGGDHYADQASPTASVTSLTRDDVQRQRVSSIEELFAGRAPGVHVVRRSDGEYSVRIRGTSSILGSNEPLVVLDGMPISHGSVSSALRGLSPQDVARIDILRDPASASMYGIRGANGVIVITTRRY
jgi:TonB-dependent SusC/RagA subfamily outer membrane receptor